MNSEQPLVSVIVPVYNARAHLESSLPAIKESDYRNFELIVVDDNSTDGSFDLAKQYADVTVKVESKVGPARARNRGAREAKGSILVFLDADIKVTPDTIGCMVKILKEDSGIVAVFGSYDESPYFSNFFSQNKNLFHHFIHQKANPEASTFWTGCGAVRKDVFCESGGFSEKFKYPSIEDVEFGYRLTEDGKRIRLAKEIQVKHLKKWTFTSVVKTDIVYRAVPWTKLAKEKWLPKDLNFKLAHRISGVASVSLFLSLLFIWRWKWVGVVSVGLAALLVQLNKESYKFFLEKKGLWFTVYSVLFHWFYYAYSSVVFGVFSIWFSLEKRFITKKKS